jgi:hypothetical protein
MRIGALKDDYSSVRGKDLSLLHKAREGKSALNLVING